MQFISRFVLISFVLFCGAFQSALSAEAAHVPGNTAAPLFVDADRFLYYVRWGYLKEVQQCLKDQSFLDLPRIGSIIKEALKIARENSNFDMVRCLEFYRAGSLDKSGLNKAFVEAVENGDVLEAEILLKMGANPNYDNGELFAIVYAIRNKDYPMIKLLKKWGVEIPDGLPKEHEVTRHRHQESNDALVAGILGNSIEMVKSALAKGADVNSVYIQSSGSRQSSPLTLALENHSNPAIIRLLLRHGADFTQKINGRSVMELAETRDSKELLKSYMKRNKNLLAAAKRGSTGSVQRALSKGANPRAQNEEGFSVLDEAIASKNHETIEQVKNTLDPRRQYYKQVIGAESHPRRWQEFCDSREAAVALLQEKDPHFLSITKGCPSAAIFSKALPAAHRQGIKGDGTKVLVLEWGTEGHWKHPDFKGVIRGQDLADHGVSVTSVVYEMAPAVACEVASQAQIEHCFRPPPDQRSAFCQRFANDTIINASLVADNVEDFVELFDNLLRGNTNVLVISAGNQPMNLRLVEKQFELLEKLFERGHKNKIIIAGGVTSSYQRARYVEPVVPRSLEGFTPDFESIIQPFERDLQARFLCALAKDVPARTERGYGKVNGTSFSAPAISGAIALLKSKYPKLSLVEIMQILLDSANKDLLSNGNPDALKIYGQGVLDVESALALGEERDLLREEVV